MGRLPGSRSTQPVLPSSVAKLTAFRWLASSGRLTFIAALRSIRCVICFAESFVVLPAPPASLPAFVRLAPLLPGPGHATPVIPAINIKLTPAKAIHLEPLTIRASGALHHDATVRAHR